MLHSAEARVKSRWVASTTIARAFMSRPARVATLVLAAALMSASYVFNAFGLQPYRYSRANAEYGHNGYANYWGARGYVPPVRTETFQIDSEMLVLRKIEASDGGRIWKDAGLLVEDEGDGPKPYVSLFGLQGQLLSLAHAHSSRPVRAWIDGDVRPVFAMLTVGIVLLLLTVFSRNLTPPLLALLAFLLAFSDWIVFVARSILYLPFLMLLPLVLGWMLPRARRASSGVVILILIFVTCLLRALCGYDAMSNVVLGATVGVVYDGLLRGAAPGKIAWKVLRVAACGAAGLATAIVLHVGQLTIVSGSVPGALHLLAGRAAARTAVPSFTLFLKTTLAYASVSMVQVPLGTYVLHIPLGFWLLVQLALLVAAARDRRAVASTPANAAAISAFWALLCSLSWAVLFPEHMTAHIHLDPLYFYLPWMPVLFYAVVLRIQEFELRRADAGLASP